MAPGTPFGASVQGLATYLRYTHAISYERLSALFAQVCGLDISEGGLANVVQSVKVRLDQRVTEILQTPWPASVSGDPESAFSHGFPL
jgi:transposase